MYQYLVANFDFKHPPTPIVQNGQNTIQQTPKNTPTPPIFYNILSSTIQQTPKYTLTPPYIIQYTIKQTTKYTTTPPYIVQYTIQKTAKYTPHKIKILSRKTWNFGASFLFFPQKNFQKIFSKIDKNNWEFKKIFDKNLK